MQIDLEEIQKKKDRLEEIKTELKTELFGLDAVIDRVVDSIKTWYFIPYLITHPIIINLFGLTGTGKTQLVRSLVKKIGFQNKFVEIQMDGISGGANYYSSSICSILQSSSIEEGEVGVILLDEFQRFRTVDKEGQDMKIERYQDVWQLLSDGRFAIDSSIFSSLETDLASTAYFKQDEDEEEEMESSKKKKKVKPQRRFFVSPWEAKSIKKLLKLKEPIQEIMTWKKDKILSLKKQFLNNNAIDFIDYSKCIIFVCGNLDEVFSVSHDVENSDTDADVFYNLTKTISVGNVKESLTRRFKPEQISRLGNNIIVYPSLPKSAYNSIIRKTCRGYIDKIKESIGIDLFVEDSAYQVIYDNSVYPAQGTRPVFSSIHKIFGSPLSEVILWALEHKIDKANIDLKAEESVFICSAIDKTITLPIDLDIQEQKKKNSLDFLSMVAIHESGHAVVHSLLFKCCPQEIAINLATYKGGYIFRKNINAIENRQDVLNGICVNLAGLCAEEIVFGPDFRSNGCSSDLVNASDRAGRFIRKWGFGHSLGLIGESNDNVYWEADYEGSNVAIEKILQEQKERTSKLLRENFDFFKETFEMVLDKKKILEKEYVELARKYISNIETKDFDTITPYSKMLQDFCSKKIK